MTKQEVLDKLEALKDTPIMVVFQEGTRMYSGIDDHYLLSDENGLIQVSKNASPYNGGQLKGMTQYDSPYVVMYGDYDGVTLITGYKGRSAKDVVALIDGKNVAGSSMSLSDIKQKIYKDKLFNVSRSASGYGDTETIVLNHAYQNISPKTQEMIDKLPKT